MDSASMQGQPHLQQKRRQSMLTKNIQEEYLIMEVKNRPVLYDKSSKVYRKPGVTENAWLEIADALRVKTEDCKKRWKSLRDTFIKYFRQELITDQPTPTKKKKWMYYDNMSFLKQHVELYGIQETESYEKECLIDNAKIDPNQKTEALEVTPDKTVYIQSENENVEEQYDESQAEYVYEDDDNVYRHEKPGNLPNSSENQEIEASSSYQKCESEKQYAITDPDEQFLLSCVPVLKRISTQKNALVKLKIQALLYEIEFGNEEQDNRKRKGSHFNY